MSLDEPPGSGPGRAAVVVPNGTLFGDGVCARIKEDLLKEFNLDGYLFGADADDISPREQRRIADALKREMLEIFYGRNLNKGIKLL